MKMGFIFAGSALLTLALGVASAQAGGRGVGQYAGNAGNFGNVSGKVHINQNGNGCRNRCYGDQTLNAGWNNGNTNTNVNVANGNKGGNGSHKGWAVIP